MHVKNNLLTWLNISGSLGNVIQHLTDSRRKGLQGNSAPQTVSAPAAYFEKPTWLKPTKPYDASSAIEFGGHPHFTKHSLRTLSFYQKNTNSRECSTPYKMTTLTILYLFGNPLLTLKLYTTLLPFLIPKYPNHMRKFISLWSHTVSLFSSSYDIKIIIIPLPSLSNLYPPYFWLDTSHGCRIFSGVTGALRGEIGLLRNPVGCCAWWNLEK